jgi:hypothetical protein
MERRWPGARESGGGELRAEVRNTHLLDPFVLGDHVSISLNADGDDLELPSHNCRSCS